MDITLAGLLASLGNALFGTGATIAQNQYNSPVSQLRRLRKAGLPLSYMYQGRVNQQSSVPQLSLEPNLGTAKKLELHQQNEINQANIKKIGEEILSIGQDINRKTYENELLGKKVAWAREPSGTIRKDALGNEFEYTNYAETFELAKNLDEADVFIKKHEGRIRNIMADVEHELFGENVQADTRRKALEKLKGQIALIASQDKVLGQLYDIRSIQAVLNKAIGDNIQEKSDLQKGILWALVQLLSKFSIR